MKFTQISVFNLFTRLNDVMLSHR